MSNHADHKDRHGAQGLLGLVQVTSALPIMWPGPSKASEVGSPWSSFPQIWGASPCLKMDHAYLVSVLLEFLEDLPEPREAGLSHAKHGEPAPRLPEVGGPTAPQGPQQVHLLCNIPHQEVASLAVEEPEGDTEMTQGHLLQAGLCPSPRRRGSGRRGEDTSSSCLQAHRKDRRDT